jgi:hypothetical protein
MAEEPFPLALHAYACVRGGPDDCHSVGHFRDQFIHNKDNPYGIHLEPIVQVDGSTYVASVNIPNAMLLEDVVESIGWRLVALADPGGAVTDCAVGNNCIVHAHLSGVDSHGSMSVIVELAILVIYVIYFSWWIYTVTSRLGTKVHTWHIEDQVRVFVCVSLSHLAIALSNDCAQKHVHRTFFHYDLSFCANIHTLYHSGSSFSELDF